MTIHKEGHGILLITIGILAALNFGVIYFFPDYNLVHKVLIAASVIFFLLILQFFRNPKIKVNANPNQVLAGADGKVVVIEEVEENEYLKTKCRQVSIFMSPINVHVNRNPLSGVISYFKYHPGKYLVAWHPKSSTENERTTVVIKHESGVEVLFRQVAGALAKRIKWYINEGDKVKQGDEFGFIKFGSRIDIYLPLEADVKVKIGDVTKGGRTVIAELN